MARQVLALVNEGPGRRVQCDRLGLGHQEQHDELLAHDAQGFVFPVGASFREEGERERLSVDDVEGIHTGLEVRFKINIITVVANNKPRVSMHVVLIMMRLNTRHKQVFCPLHSPTVKGLKLYG